MQAHRKFGTVVLMAIFFTATGLLAQSAPLADAPSATVEIAASTSHDGDLLKLASTSADMSIVPISTTAAVPAPVAYVTTPTPVKSKTVESTRDKKIWYALTIANHSAVAFDSYSTRYAVSRGAQELNPTLKPFANSNWLYPAMQAGAVGMDYLSHRMMRSKHTMLRKMWWLPQSANTVSSLVAGVHNMSR